MGVVEALAVDVHVVTVRSLSARFDPFSCFRADFESTSSWPFAAASAGDLVLASPTRGEIADVVPCFAWRGSTTVSDADRGPRADIPTIEIISTIVSTTNLHIMARTHTQHSSPATNSQICHLSGSVCKEHGKPLAASVAASVLRT